MFLFSLEIVGLGADRTIVRQTFDKTRRSVIREPRASQRRLVKSVPYSWGNTVFTAESIDIGIIEKKKQIPKMKKKKINFYIIIVEVESVGIVAEPIGERKRLTV